jgi:hypothetical protein
MRRSILVLLGLIVPLCACDNSGDSTAPTVVLTSQVFTGTLNVGGSSTNINFTMAQPGEVDITLVAGPPSNIILGFGVGIPSSTDGSCAVPSANATTIQAGGGTLTGSEAVAGPYCVKLFDAGYMTAPISYTLTVAHQ